MTWPLLWPPCIPEGLFILKGLRMPAGLGELDIGELLESTLEGFAKGECAAFCCPELGLC